MVVQSTAKRVLSCANVLGGFSNHVSQVIVEVSVVVVTAQASNYNKGHTKFLPPRTCCYSSSLRTTMLAYRGDAKRVFVDAVQNGGGLRHTHNRVDEESSQLLRGR